MPHTHMTESMKPSCPVTPGSASAIARATAQADESGCALRPSSPEADATSDMAHERTAETGAPQNATKSAVTPRRTTARARCPSREPASAAP